MTLSVVLVHISFGHHVHDDRVVEGWLHTKRCHHLQCVVLLKNRLESSQDMLDTIKRREPTRTSLKVEIGGVGSHPQDLVREGQLTAPRMSEVFRVRDVETEPEPLQLLQTDHADDLMMTKPEGWKALRLELAFFTCVLCRGRRSSFRR